MSLVNYDGSSSESEEENNLDAGNGIRSTSNKPKEPADDDFFTRNINPALIRNHDEQIRDALESAGKSQQNLCPDTKKNNVSSNYENVHALLKRKLPAPQKHYDFTIKEEDDDFLHRKSIITQPQVKPPVKIRIPSLKEFTTLTVPDKKVARCQEKSTFSLLNMLPEPKSNDSRNVAKPVSKITKTTSFIPNSVKTRLVESKTKKQNILGISQSDDDDDDEDDDDFFSLNKKNVLPEVSANEIDIMVVKKAAQIAKAGTKLDELDTEKQNAQPEQDDYAQVGPSNANLEFDQKAINALVGSQARRRGITEIEMKDLSSSEILPDRTEWLRSALASETTYQPQGLLTDEEPAAGTRKKHQITYLAHQAKANESELKSMWATSRQNRRANANKYGF